MRPSVHGPKIDYRRRLRKLAARNIANFPIVIRRLDGLGTAGHENEEASRRREASSALI
jgi:hypothetical protein